MKKFNINNESPKNPEEQHKELLGMDVPKDYFKSSKAKIMEKISISEKQKSRVFYLKPVVRYAIAASVVLLIAIGIALKFNANSNDNSNLQNIQNLANVSDEDILINSLLVSDENMDAFLDNYIVDGIMVQAEVEEQQFDNLFMNSVFVNDSLLDTYIDDRFVEEIIL